MSDISGSLEVKKIKYKTAEPMYKHTTFRVGGAAALAVWPANEKELILVLDMLKGRKYIVIGNGSNVVFPDGGYDGAVVFTERLSAVSADGFGIGAESGIKLSSLACFARDNCLGGLEFAHGIPGSLGGAVYMNAGAYGGEMKNVVQSVRFYNGEEIRELAADKLDFGYRSSLFAKNNNYVILSARLELFGKDRSEIESEMAELMGRRKEKQPLNYPSAGSVFKRPAGSFAGKLIEDAGLKGRRCGGMEVSRKHAGFIVNTGGGTAEDLKGLIGEIREEVFKKFGVTLETEVKFII